MDSHPRDVGGAISISRKSVEQIECVRTCFRIGICQQEVQPVSELFFNSRLQTVIVAAPLCCGVACAAAKVEEWLEQVGICICRQNLTHLIGSGEYLQMTGHCTDIASLNRQGWS